LKKQSAPGRYNSLASNSNSSKAESGRKGLLSCGPVDFAHIRPRVDTGLAPPPALGLKKSNSAVRIREPFAAAAPVVQKRSEPSVLPSQVRPGCGGSGPFKVPDRPGGGAFNRNSAQRQSLTRLFSRNGDKSKKANSLGRDVRTPFGETGGCAAPASTADRRSQFIKKRSITSLSLFSGGGKKEEDHGGGGGRPEPVKVLFLYDAFLLSYWSLSFPFSSAIGRRDFLSCPVIGHCGFFSSVLYQWNTSSLQRPNAENSKHKILPEKELRGHSPNFHINVSATDLYFPTIDLPILLQEICGPTLGMYKSLTDT
jgi:hypothetical protein